MPCAKCGNENADKKCGKCFVTLYCSRECQQQHWKAHKKLCGKLANEYHERNKDGEGAHLALPQARLTYPSCSLSLIRSACLVSRQPCTLLLVSATTGVTVSDYLPRMQEVHLASL